MTISILDFNLNINLAMKSLIFFTVGLCLLNFSFNHSVESTSTPLTYLLSETNEEEIGCPCYRSLKNLKKNASESLENHDLLYSIIPDDVVAVWDYCVPKGPVDFESCPCLNGLNKMLTSAEKPSEK